MEADVPPLIAALLDARRCPEPTVRMALVETHGAWVLLGDAHAWKIKKPVRLPFMDFGTLDRRRAACEAEIRVNRRFAPEHGPALYQGVRPVRGSTSDPRWGELDGLDAPGAIEYAVQMRRFDEACRLDHLCARRAIGMDDMAALARHVAGFQARAAAAPPDSPWGLPEGVLAWARDNFATLRELGPGGSEADALPWLAGWTEARFAALAGLLAARRAEGRIREGHGDLHLANLVKLGDEVVAFDAIEFNDELRWIDTASDIAFTWMDLRRQGAPGLANGLLSAWLDACGDVTAPRVLPFFAVYRALVRAKVAAIRRAQIAHGPGARTALDEEIALSLALARRMAQPAAPRLVITHGLSGSGKTWASTRWLQAEATGHAIRLRSDVERKRLHGLAALQASGSGLNSGLYTAQAHGDTYASLLSRSRELLQDNWSVIVDAAFLRRHERDAFAALAAGLGCPFHILACEAPPDELRRRIRERQARGNDASEATLAVLEQQFGWLEPLGATERDAVIAAPLAPSA